MADVAGEDGGCACSVSELVQAELVASGTREAGGRESKRTTTDALRKCLQIELRAQKTNIKPNEERHMTNH